MPKVFRTPTRIPVPGGKVIDEHIGRVNSGTEAVSVAHMSAPAGWTEPFQAPEFDEITVVLKGTVLVEHGEETYQVHAGQSILTSAGERVRYSTGAEPTEYVAVCLPAFAEQLAHRDDEQEGDGAA